MGVASDIFAGIFAGPAPRLGIGTVALAVPYGPPGAERAPPEPAAARRTLREALARGVRFFDTAPAYGEAEALVGAALADAASAGVALAEEGARAGCLVATKLAIPDSGWGALSPREVRAHVRSSARASLRALRRERLDLLQIHNAEWALLADGAVVEALLELREEGLVASVGATVYGEADALVAIADPGIEAVQIAYSALDRRPERRVLPAAAANGTAVVARSLLLHGVLTAAGRDLHGPFAPLGEAADAVRRAWGADWDELPGAAVAYVAHRPGIACALMGPRDTGELHALLEQVERFGGAAGAPVAEVTGVAELPDWLLDPSRWPVEEHVGC
jgi:D-threo-aldose 1-dehydrogenase